MIKAPELWIESAAPEQVFRRVSEGPSTLMLDYYGTLAPFARDRLRALPYPGVLQRLERLAGVPGVRLVLITGRPVRELKAVLNPESSIEMWGSHGREQLTRAGTYHFYELPPEQGDALDAITKQLRDQVPPEALERKPASLAVHWRTLPEHRRKDLEECITRLYSKLAAPADLQLLRFDGGLEVRSGDLNKGSAVLRILEEQEEQSQAAAVAYLGDDTTDEDAFRVLRGKGVPILVRETWRESAAEFWIRPPSELLGFLDGWIAAALRRTR